PIAHHLLDLWTASQRYSRTKAIIRHLIEVEIITQSVHEGGISILQRRKRFCLRGRRTAGYGILHGIQTDKRRNAVLLVIGSDGLLHSRSQLLGDFIKFSFLVIA